MIKSTTQLAAKNALDPLEKLHKRIIRIITKSHYRAHTMPLFRDLHLLKIKDICQHELAKSMYKITKNGNCNTKSKFHIPSHTYYTKQTAKQNSYIPKRWTEIVKKAFAYVGPKVWQEIPINLNLFHLFASKRKWKII